jgi:hypothetical protein
MKKVLLMLIFSAMFFTTGVFATEKLAMLANNEIAPVATEEAAPAPAEEEKSDFPNIVCVDSVTWSLLPKNLDKAILAESANASLFVIPGTEKVDKKNKTITVWVTALLTFSGQEAILADFNDDGKEIYKNIGYKKILAIFDFKTKKYKFLNISEYNCDGSVIHIFKDYSWDYIVPDSVFEGIYIDLKKKYNL